MTNYNSNNENFDRGLDAALAQYTAVEPRAGLEERILANLEARNRAPVARWWAWPAVVAVVMLIAFSLAWRLADVRRGPVARQTSPATQNGGLNRTPVQSAGSVPQVPSSHSASVKISHRKDAHSPVVVAAVPHLSQFPSPRPLSEQEQILASYVANYPQHAALLAQAHAEDLRRDLADDAAKHRALPAGDSLQ